MSYREGTYDFWHHLMAHRVRLNMGGEASVGSLLKEGLKGKKASRKRATEFGISACVGAELIMVNPGAPQLRQALRDSDWGRRPSTADVRALLMGLPFADDAVAADAWGIGGVGVRCDPVCFPLTLLFGKDIPPYALPTEEED